MMGAKVSQVAQLGNGRAKNLGTHFPNYSDVFSSKQYQYHPYKEPIQDVVTVRWNILINIFIFCSWEIAIRVNIPQNLLPALFNLLPSSDNLPPIIVGFISPALPIEVTLQK